MASTSMRRHLSFGGRLHPDLGALIAITVALSLATAILGRNGVPLFEWLAFVPAAVMHGEVWRLVTGNFIETSPLSLLFACLMIYWFGRDLSSVWGPRRFVLLYLFIGLFANALTTAIALVDTAARAFPYVGSWPVAEAMVIAWAATYPEREIRIYFVIPVSGRMLLYFTVGMIVLLAAFTGVTGYWPHLAAAAFMLVYTGTIVPRRYLLQLRGWWRRTRREERVRSASLQVMQGGKRKVPGQGPSDEPPRPSGGDDSPRPRYWN